MIFFESCNSTKMKGTFNCHFDFAFTFFLKVAIQRTWKGLSTVILTLFSQPKPGWPFCRSFLKVSFQWKWKGLSAVILAWFQSKSSRALLLIRFESCNSMKWKGLSTFILALLPIRSFSMIPWRARDVYWTFGCSLWKLNVPAVLGRFCTELACPCQLSYSYTMWY